MSAISAMFIFGFFWQAVGVNAPVPASIPKAEAEGTAFPREALPESLPSGFRPGEVKGTGERKCVEFPEEGFTNSMDTSRHSGEFVVGGLLANGVKRGVLMAGVEEKVFWVPLHDPVTRKAALNVRSVRLDRPAFIARFTSAEYAWPDVKREHGFYPSGFSLPDAGRWLIVATSGPDWGCFIVTVR